MKNTDFSQHGEQGIIKSLLATMPNDGYCVEFGAWDGYLFSNTRGLIEDGWQGVFIEGDKQRFKELKYKDRDSIVINAYVGDENKLDDLLNDKVPADFDVLSVDIDGDDYHVWADFVKHKPKIVVIEYNGTIPVKFVNPKGKNVGSSIYSLIELAESKGYSFHSHTETNVIFVDKKYLPTGNKLPEIKGVSVFFGYDGSVHYYGNKRLFWHGVEMKEKQTLPFFMIGYRGGYNLFQKLWFRLFYNKPKEVPHHLRHKK